MMYDRIGYRAKIRQCIPFAADERYVVKQLLIVHIFPFFEQAPVAQKAHSGCILPPAMVDVLVAIPHRGEKPPGPSSGIH
jgi:hypothetical protein